MKKSVFNIFMAFLLMTGLSGFAEKISYPDSWGKTGFTLESGENTSVRINYSIDNFSIDDLTIGDQILKEIHVPGIFLPNDEGAPNLPGTGRYIAIPQGATVSYQVIASRTEVFKNIDIAPAPRIPLDTETGPLEYNKDNKIYSKNEFYPAQPVIISENSKIRGVDVVMLGITPFQYNPITKELIIYRDLKIEISFKGGNGHFGDDRLRSRWWDPIIKDAVLNPGSLPEINYNKPKAPSDTPDYEYIIISPDDPVFLSWADSIKTFRTLQGIYTGIVTTTDVGGNTTTAIENYIDNAYNTWTVPPAAVLLLGDYGTSGSTVISPIYNSYCASDNIYADVDGDQLPDVVLARMTAQNATHLETMITKFLDYERNPPVSASFYDHPITALGWQTERWFQICSETVGGFWKNELGKNPVRINAVYGGDPTVDPWSTATNTSTVVDYFGPSGLGYIPATPQELGGFSGGTATDVENAINAGAFALQHRDHGGETGWGEPGFQSSNIDNLTNTDLPWIFSINCLTGKFNISGECFAEKFHRYTYGGHNSGALGITAATEVSYSFVNDTYVWGLYDNMWTNFMPAYGTNPPSRGELPAFANAAGKYFLQQSSWPYNTSNKEVTYHLFHHHGDAFTVLYSEVPQYLTVNHASTLLAGASSFTVTADAGSFIALTVNGVIIGTADGTGAPVAITIPPQNVGDVMIVTVTKQNYYRYSSNVDVIPPSGPYITYNSHSINDASGNNNGEADFGENILLDMTLENVGSDPANNVNATLVCADPYITITDNSESFGTINAGATATVNDAYAFTIADNIPDQYVLNFELQITGTSDDTWTSYFSITVNAPELETGLMTIDDAAGGNGNGRLDPGETADITIETTNNGHSDSPAANATLACASPYITINNPSYAVGVIADGTTESAVFSVTVDASTPVGTNVNFSFNATAGNYSASNTYSAVVGLIPVLILDLDPNASSGTVMETSLINLGVAYDYTTTFPSDLNLYSSVFVCLGIYSSNHVLSGTEGQTLADYLNTGGQIYMEGGDTWYYDASTVVHPMFNIDPQADGSSDMSTVTGKAGTFTEGMSFNYSGENNWMDHLAPISPAFLILENQTPLYGTGVAYDAGTYKTIGTSHEFCGLDDGTSPSTKDDLMNEYLTFFGITGTPLLPADIDVSPVSFYVTLAPDETTNETLTIYNNGELSLNYSISVDETSTEAGKMSQTLSQEQKQALRNKNTNVNAGDELINGQTFPDNWVLPPITKYGPEDNKGEETFGSWSGGTYSGGTRDRGNIYHITSTVSLTEFRFYLNISSSTQLYFVVYESTSLTGTFTKIAENYIAGSGTGEGWYSSGSMSVTLEAGKYYYLCTSWNGTVTYGRGTESVPLATSFGTLETGIPGTQAGYPPAASFTNSYTGTAPYYQTVVTGEPVQQWLIPNPTSGSVAALSSYEVDVLFDATGLTDGVYTKNLVINSNDPDEPQVIVPCTLEVFSGISVNLKAYLEGPYSGLGMAVSLNSSGYLPLDQPYNVAPWDYTGTESVTAIPNANVVDWVLVELRETTGGASSADPSTVIDRQAGFILNDGTIVGIDGTSPLRFGDEITNNLFIVVYQRNHIGIMTANPVLLSGEEYVYDFSTGEAQVYGGADAHKEIASGIWGMISGDADANGEIDNKDKNDFWKVQLGSSGYLSADFDMNGQVESADKTAKWKGNAGNCSHIVK